MTRTLLALMLLILTTQAYADAKGELTHAYGLYKKGAYPQALDALKRVPTQPQTAATVQYWSGLCYSRLQNFSEAIAAFRKAAQLGSTAEDLNYELGQALYASQDLKPAREAFRKSAAQGFKPTASIYYIGFSSQLLEEHGAALAAYDAIQGMGDDPEKVKQAALLQKAEVKFAQAELEKNSKSKDQTIRNIVIPAFEKANTYDATTGTATHARARIAELRKRIGDETEPLANGTRASARPWNLKLTQDFKYDTNVVIQANESLLSVSDKASFFSKTSINGSYEFVTGKRWVFTPEVDAYLTRYLNRTEPRVFENDSLSLSPALRTRHEHQMFNAAAATLIDFEGNYLIRDYRRDHSFPYYSRSYNLVVGERLKLFLPGSTTIKANFKIFGNQDEQQNALNPGITLTQNVQLKPTTGLSFTLGFDMNDAKVDTYDRTNFRFTPVLSLVSLFFETDVNASLDLTLTDTLGGGRGYEKTITPSLTATKRLNKHIGLGVNYTFTRNISQDKANYDYTKHAFGIALSYRL